MRLNLRKKLLGGFGIVLILMIILGGVLFYSLNLIEDENRVLEQNMEQHSFFQEKELDHVVWVNQLSNTLLTEEKFEGELNPTECSFGNWYYSLLESERYDRLPAEVKEIIQNLEAPHKKLHQSAKEIKSIFAEYGYDSEEGRRLALEVYQTETLKQLDKIEHYFEQYQSYLTKQQNQARSTVERHTLFANRTGIILLIVTVIIGVIVALAINKRITYPIIKAEEFAEKIAAGDLDIDSLEVENDDEIGVLANSLNQMQANLQELVADLIDTIEELTAYSEELTASAQEGNATIETTNELIENISASIQQISAGAEEVASFANEADTKTESGSENIQDALESMADIRNSVEGTVDIIEELDAYSKEIGQIINLITDISEQTNLLALNAAIEAARAGEAGQGFSVVAEEIRQLAEETNEATERIAELINKTQQKADVGLEAVQEVETKVAKGQEIIDKTGDVFGEIKDNSKATALQIEDTADAAQQLAESSDEVNQAAQDIGNMSDEIAASSQELANMSQDLERLVNKFNV
ncbi:methyl-accepting chemotaxis protein [Acetohalobium arabaticum]|uniref:Methyl-accepting chemotaxis sensory transducer n=1 Tax=Acetohalobium arabaticum (strain ATCC 49924 / DSM 5501 / Z-7288) TaxID=574087 RepID=D9QT93_ACEAZ|nr:methyl-accepting chemotaxis protein [Acetohalobium arabaticum]ADL13593.1 methyl-accepting chemotaxis sensory transducer [Acetohalobium arabaticum DSM 5501]